MTIDPEYLLALIEEIAFHTSNRTMEKPIYLQGVKDASEKRSAEALHGDLRTRPATREGPVPEHEPRGNAQVRSDAGKGPTPAQDKAVKKPA